MAKHSDKGIIQFLVHDNYHTQTLSGKMEIEQNMTQHKQGEEKLLKIKSLSLSLIFTQTSAHSHTYNPATTHTLRSFSVLLGKNLGTGKHHSS